MFQVPYGLRTAVAFRRALLLALTSLAALWWAAPAAAQSAAQSAVDAAKKVRRQDDHHRLGGRPAVARSAQLLRPEVGGAHRHQGQGGRGADRRDVHQDHAGVPRRHRRLRRAQRDPGLDARPRAGRRARGRSTPTSTSTASATSCRRSRRSTATTR